MRQGQQKRRKEKSPFPLPLLLSMLPLGQEATCTRSHYPSAPAAINVKNVYIVNIVNIVVIDITHEYQDELTRVDCLHPNPSVRSSVALESVNRASTDLWISTVRWSRLMVFGFFVIGA
jgi:hypothetical protein